MSNKLRILHIIPNLKKGGAERLVLDICNELNKRPDVIIKLITFSAENEYQFLSKTIDWEVVPAFVKLSLRKKNQYHVKDLQKAIEEFQPNVIHTHLYEAELVSRSCFYPNARWFSHCHSNMPAFFESHVSLKQRVIYNYEKRFLFKRYNKNGGTNFIAISNHTFQFYKKKVKPYPLDLLPNGINYNRFLSNEKYQIKETLRLVSIGSVKPLKNHIFLINVAKLLLQKKIEFTLTIIGDGSLMDELKLYIVKNNLQSKVFLVGSKEKVEQYLWESDIYVHSSKSEALGLTMVEAMAAGLPVVTLDGGGNRDLIVNGFNGYLLNEENVDVFTSTLLKLWNNKELYLNQKNNAISFAKKFDIVKYVDSLKELYLK